MKDFLSYLKPYKRDAIAAIFCIEAETYLSLSFPLSWLPSSMLEWLTATDIIF